MPTLSKVSAAIYFVLVCTSAVANVCICILMAIYMHYWNQLLLGPQSLRVGQRRSIGPNSVRVLPVLSDLGATNAK